MPKKASTKSERRFAKYLKSVQDAAKTASDWIVLNNQVFGINTELGQKMAQDEEFRKEFTSSETYREIQALIRDKMKTEGTPEPQVSGRVLVRMPKSLHQALLSEAQEEGVSLNQLIVTKLSGRLGKAL